MLLAFLGVMTLGLPTFDVMQSFSPVMALPFSVYFLVLIYASYVTARDYYRENLMGSDEDPSSPSPDSTNP